MPPATDSPARPLRALREAGSPAAQGSLLGFTALAGLAALTLLLVLHRGSLGVPPISDDGAVLGYVHRQGAWSDWAASQYQLSSVRFWRPLVTTSLGLQEAWSGVEPLPLRLFNLVCQAFTALFAGVVAVRLGSGRVGGLLAALLVAAFPYQGGTVTWLVGRVDSLSQPWVLASVAAALVVPRTADPELASAGSRSRGHGAWDRGPGPAWEALGLVAAFAALATKEIAVVLPAWVFLAALGAGHGLRGAARRAWPATFALVVVAVWRQRALGVWLGGYADPGPVEWGPTLWRMLGGWSGAALAVGLLAASPARFLGGKRGLAAVAAGLALALAARLPLVHLFGTGPVAPEHLRTLALSDVGLVLALVVAAARPSSEWAATARPRLARGFVLVACALLLGLLAVRVQAARGDVLRWSAAAELGEEHVARTRSVLADEAPSSEPVLDATFPRIHDGAYVLHWGVADRFRAPFPESPRPVWPWRPLFGFASSERPQLVFTPRAGLVWPFGGAARQVPELSVTVGGRAVTQLVLDERLFVVDLSQPVDRSPVLEVWGDAPAERLEFVLYTELGYEPAVWASPGPGAVEPGPRGVPETLRRISLREVFSQTGAVVLFQAVAQAADLGVEQAYLELRAVDDARGVRHRPIAASRWILLTWDAELRAALWP